jgi:S-methylmethionine-dependent homocysteine/selenocysteine methylase
MAGMPSLADALATGPVLLDGGLSTELEARGHDVSSALWSARLLRDDPAAIVAAHAAFAAAGAQVATTASYQATAEGFAAVGVDADEARRLIAFSVALAREGQGEGWVAGSVGPYGALLADGSEYTGAYVAEVGLAQLREFHRPRMELLAEAGADVLACETVPAAAEAEALLAEAEALGVPIWLSLTTVVDAAGLARTRRGELAADVSPWRPTATSPSPSASTAPRLRTCCPRSTLRRPAGSPSSSTRTVARAGTPPLAAGPARPGSRRTTSPAGSPPAPGWWAAAAASGRRTSPRSPPQWLRDGAALVQGPAASLRVAGGAGVLSQRMGLPPVTAIRAPEM